jgi:hypothetical protein
MGSLTGMRVLIADDDMRTSQDLTWSLRTAGATVLGPFPTLARAMPLVGSVNAAILELVLDGQQTYPLADSLQDLNTPIIFYSGHSLSDLPRRYFSVPRLEKPDPANEDVGGDGLMVRTRSADVNAALPKLRLIARLLFEDLVTADRLAELTLMTALKERDNRPESVQLDDWLIAICLRMTFQVDRFLN